MAVKRRLSIATTACFILGALWSAPYQPAAAQSTADAAASFVDDFSTFNVTRWQVSDGWVNGVWQNCTWSKRQLRLADGVLVLKFAGQPYKERQYSCAEIQTRERFSYGVYEARFRTSRGSGLNAAFFTYIGGQHDQPHDEIDFEVLLRDTSHVTVNTFVGGTARHGQKIAVEGTTDGQFNDYAFVWEKDRLRWYVNGDLVHQARGAELLPSHPQKIFVSLWGSDTFTEWMGPFEDPQGDVEMHLDRVAFTHLDEPCQFPESVACGLD